MSLPPAPMAVASMSAATAINPIEFVFTSINTNPYFIGLMMLLLNLGGRFIGMEISKDQEKFLQQPMIRRALIFTVLFVATRNVFVALIMSAIVLLLMSFLFNENSDLYLWSWPSVAGENKGADPSLANSGLTPEELEIWRRLNDKQNRLAATAAKDKKEEKPPASTIEEIYAFNLNRLQR